AQVEENVRQAVRAVTRRDAALAQAVIDGDTLVDQQEVTIEEECLKILALHQPVAHDLRFLVSILKLNHTLERIGDLSVNIAKRAKTLSEQPHFDVPIDFTPIAEKAPAMLHKSLDALINMDINLARQVGEADDEVDALNREIYARVKSLLRERPDDIETLIMLLNVSRHLERIADHASSIAEDVIYLIEGKIIRHQH
ncbi:MAG: phosphate signaling complex protein PhoU, partial [Kiritimatiellaeota bacterium]|nr:phosphate signaling complex protein PhoU [Kiritimatiellota bacterium]